MPNTIWLSPWDLVRQEDTGVKFLPLAEPMAFSDLTTWAWVAQCRAEEAGGLCSWKPSTPTPDALRVPPAALLSRACISARVSALGKSCSVRTWKEPWKAQLRFPPPVTLLPGEGNSQWPCMSVKTVSRLLGPGTWRFCSASTVIEAQCRTMALALLEKQCV